MVKPAGIKLDIVNDSAKIFGKAIPLNNKD